MLQNPEVLERARLASWPRTLGTSEAEPSSTVFRHSFPLFPRVRGPRGRTGASGPEFPVASLRRWQLSARAYAHPNGKRIWPNGGGVARGGGCGASPSRASRRSAA